ncbi:hypothetical protein M670_00113 [Schinkia azotoformans MEV2011]|uniref:Uncharacterized protein n=1 Tax=Schinkia azotoformans MEV2011 TaxID=1348973 RepID=A0A072NTE0_SCHAZ|nr:hypothetical protein [Schinkia azotoformans]KEF40098.1 hypothetical protein M670_00113 [Schinkia azotoformans MEV2011]
MLDYVDFLSGVMTAVLAYAMFKERDEPEEDDILENDEGYLNNYEDDDFGRTVTMSCQGCRKLKRHREIEHNLYQCTKCKRLVDLRRKSS